MAPKQRKIVGNEDSASSSKQQRDEQQQQDNIKTKGPPSKHSGVSFVKSVSRFLLCAALLAVVYVFSYDKKELTFASQTEHVTRRAVEVPCSSDYEKERVLFKGCAPQRCGRLVTDTLVTKDEVSHLLKIAQRGMALGGSSGGASILDLHSGALSQGQHFVNVYLYLKSEDKQSIFTEEDFHVYRQVKNKIHSLIAREYGIPSDMLYLTHPTFFSRMTSAPATTLHDEYWHVHVDKETYQSFHYTSLVYLADYNKDFTGGRFIFLDKQKNITVEPKMGRVSLFTSGSENPHFVEKVSSGTRYALTVSFTCDKKYSISDPSLNKYKKSNDRQGDAG